MDGVILAAVIACMIVSLYAILSLIFGAGGTKGITKQYKSKDGVTRTAKKERSDHIV
jgi:hypothetical protein|tara:strand:- start:606 stop:776 length:171 start_codon:yes stop_codon:yes gene_type:complete